MGEYFAFTEAIKKSGHYVGGEALQPVADGDDRARPERQDVDDRRPVRRDEGTARRLLPDRRQGPERRDPGGVADSVGRIGSVEVRPIMEFLRTEGPRFRWVTSSEDAIARGGRTRSYRSDSRRVLATLIRLLGDFDLAEEALHDAFAAAVEQWPREGVPGQSARLARVDRPLQGHRRHAPARPVRCVPGASSPQRLEAETGDRRRDCDDEGVEDDRLRLIFTCCHPALPPDAQVALTLREVCGLTTEEIARAFLVAAPTVAQRIVRAKAKIRDARIPYQVPDADRPARLDSTAVLHVVYLVFNEGYSASSGESLTRARSLGRGDPPGPAAGRAAARARGGRPAGADAAPRVAPGGADVGRRASWSCSTIRTARSGIRAQIAEGSALVERALVLAALRALHAAGGDRGGARRGAGRRRHRLAADRRALRRAAAGGSLAGGRAESRRGGGDARWSSGRTRADRRDSGSGRSGGLPPRALGRADLCRRLGRAAEARVAMRGRSP